MVSSRLICSHSRTFMGYSRWFRRTSEIRWQGGSRPIRIYKKSKKMKKCRLTLHPSPCYKRRRAGRYRWISSSSSKLSRLAVHANSTSPRMKRWSRSTLSSHSACTWYIRSASKWLSRNLSAVRLTFNAQNARRECPKWRLGPYLEILSLRRWTKLRNPNCLVRIKI